MFIISFLFLIILNFLLVIPSYAQCPVCIITVGGGMFLAKKLGIDDFLISMWISGLDTAISFWLAPKIKIKFLNNPIILSLILFATTLLYFQFTDQIGGITNKIMGLDKIILGHIFGLLFMLLGIFIDKFTRIKNNGKILFPYQKVVFPVGTLLIFTLLFKLLFKL
jgi:hypothetical protein